MKTLKLSDCSDAQIKAILSKIYLFIGIRPESFPSKEMEALTIHYIRECYGHRGSKELMLAFELAVFKKLDVEVNAFDQFSVAYLANIMSAYRQKCNQEIINQVKEKELPSLPPAKISRDEMQKELESYKNTTLSLELIPLYLYDYMQELGHDITVTQQILWKACMIRKNFLYCQVENDIDRKKEYGAFNRMLDEGEITGAEKLIVNNLAKRIIVHKFLHDTKNGRKP